ncbi:MAG: hypothetical protein ACP5NV_02200 [Candidatus Woesearchaeota archaeon]
MRFSNEFNGLMKNSRYKYARVVLDSVLGRGVIDEKVLKKLYGPSSGKILAFAQEFILEFPKEKYVVRDHDVSAPVLISDARLKIGKDKNFQLSHHELLKFNVPEERVIKKFFGKHSRDVVNSYKLFIDSKKLRKSGISMTCHHNRVACTFYQLNKDNSEVQYYSAIAALHDFIEDLIYSLKDENGVRYTIENYQVFLDKFIPKELQAPIKLLTNHYDMILKYVDYHLDRVGRRFNKGNVLEFLKNLEYEKYETLKNHISRIISMIDEMPYSEMSSKNYLEDLKWRCYTELYIPELVNMSYDDKENLLLLIKIVDLADNNSALEGVDLDSKIKNIRKSVITADLISKLDKARILDSYVREIRENSLVKAEFLVLKDLMQQESVQDFFVDALVKIRRMKDVFYEQK